MKELTDLLAGAGAKKTSDFLSHFQLDTTMVEELLSAFNNTPQNSRVVEYIFHQNLFDMIGKSRHEMVHSRMIAELLGGRYFDISNKMTLMHFFDIVITRAKEQGVRIPQEFSDAVLTRSLDIDSLADKQTEYFLTSYLKEYGKKSDDGIDKRQRLDIFLRYNLASTLKKNGNKAIEIIIENKVLSLEHDQQTQVYYDTCSDGRKAVQLFVYLSPISQRELSDYAHVSDTLKPVCKDPAGNPVFIHICYQDIFDKIIAPLMEDRNLNMRDSVILEEYASCLELPAMPDDEAKLGTKELSIMAISDHEKQMLTDFMSNENNARLLEAAVACHLGNKLYAYGGADCLSFDQALIEALKNFTRYNSEHYCMKKFKDVFVSQKGGARFLIYAVKETDDKLYYIPTHLFEYDGKPYKTITDALKVAVKHYISRTGKSTQEVIADFECLTARLRYHPHVFKKDGKQVNGTSYLYYPTDFADLFIRNEIPQDKLVIINNILGDGFAIKPISDKCYHDLLLSGDDNLWECYEKRLFVSLPGTKYFYRKGAEERIDAIKDILQICERSLSESDIHLLETFYKNNSKLILSIYRILIENEQDIDTYERRKKEYRKLLKA